MSDDGRSGYLRFYASESSGSHVTTSWCIEREYLNVDSDSREGMLCDEQPSKNRIVKPKPKNKNKYNMYESI